MQYYFNNILKSKKTNYNIISEEIARLSQYSNKGDILKWHSAYPTFFSNLFFWQGSKNIYRKMSRSCQPFTEWQITCKMKNLQVISHHLHFYKILCTKINNNSFSLRFYVKKIKMILFLCTHFCPIPLSKWEVATPRTHL